MITFGREADIRARFVLSARQISNRVTAASAVCLLSEAPGAPVPPAVRPTARLLALPPGLARRKRWPRRPRHDRIPNRRGSVLSFRSRRTCYPGNVRTADTTSLAIAVGEGTRTTGTNENTKRRTERHDWEDDISLDIAAGRCPDARDRTLGDAPDDRRRRGDAQLQARRELAQAVAQQLDSRADRGHRGRRRRQRLAGSARALAQQARGLRHGRARRRRQPDRQCRRKTGQRARPRAPGGRRLAVLRPGAGGDEIRLRGQPAAGLGRAGRPRLLGPAR